MDVAYYTSKAPLVMKRQTTLFDSVFTGTAALTSAAAASSTPSTSSSKRKVSVNTPVSSVSLLSTPSRSPSTPSRQRKTPASQTWLSTPSRSPSTPSRQRKTLTSQTTPSKSKALASASRTLQNNPKTSIAKFWTVFDFRSSSGMYGIILILYKLVINPVVSFRYKASSVQKEKKLMRVIKSLSANGTVGPIDFCGNGKVFRFNGSVKRSEARTIDRILSC